MKKRIILVGAGASGKDYFRNYLNNLEEKLDVSYTTRPSRKGEVVGYTYNYISEEDFLDLRASGFFLEAVEFNGWHYGTSLANWSSKSVFIMTPSGTKHIPASDRKNCIFVYFDMPINIRKKRLAKRSDADSADRRIKADEEDFKDFKDFDIRVTNPFYDAEQLYKTIMEYEVI